MVKYRHTKPGITHVPWQPYLLEGARRTLILSDIHVPFQDDAALLTALEYGRKKKADTILLNGDIADCYTSSRFIKDPDLALSVSEERDRVYDFLRDLRRIFPKAEIIYKLGNHEERFELLTQEKNGELHGSPELIFENYFHLKDLGIKSVRDKNEIRLGRLTVMHGHEWNAGYSSPVNPARGLFNKAKINALAGHLHQTSQHSESNIRGEITSTWSTGCLCDLRPQYARINKWNHGFAFVTTDKQGVFEVNNLRIIEGKVY